MSLVQTETIMKVNIVQEQKKNTTTWTQDVCISVYFTNGVINTLRLRQNGSPFSDDTLKCIFLNENVIISIEISLKFDPKGQLTIFQHWFR